MNHTSAVRWTVDVQLLYSSSCLCVSASRASSLAAGGGGGAYEYNIVAFIWMSPKQLRTYGPFSNVFSRGWWQQRWHGRLTWTVFCSDNAYTPVLSWPFSSRLRVLFDLSSPVSPSPLCCAGHAVLCQAQAVWTFFSGIFLLCTCLPACHVTSLWDVFFKLKLMMLDEVALISCWSALADRRQPMVNMYCTCLSTAANVHIVHVEHVMQIKHRDILLQIALGCTILIIVALPGGGNVSVFCIFCSYCNIPTNTVWVITCQTLNHDLVLMGSLRFSHHHWSLCSASFGYGALQPLMVCSHPLA